MGNLSAKRLEEKAMVNAAKNGRIFKNPTGQGYAGGSKFTATKDGTIPVKQGDIIIKNPGVIKYGLSVGSSDCIGWQSVIIDDNFIERNKGCTIAIFKAVEIKTVNDKIDREQIIFYLSILEAGGIAQVFHDGLYLTTEEVYNLPRRSEKGKHAKEIKMAKDLIINRKYFGHENFYNMLCKRGDLNEKEQEWKEKHEKN